MTEEQKNELVQRYLMYFWCVTDLARSYKVTRQTVYNVLKENGVSDDALYMKRYVTIPCQMCKGMTTVSRVKARRMIDDFFLCSKECEKEFEALRRGRAADWIITGSALVEKMFKKHGIKCELSKKYNHLSQDAPEIDENGVIIKYGMGLDYAVYMSFKYLKDKLTREQIITDIFDFYRPESGARYKLIEALIDNYRREITEFFTTIH